MVRRQWLMFGGNWAERQQEIFKVKHEKPSGE
jgi:hypothetical protein